MLRLRCFRGQNAFLAGKGGHEWREITCSSNTSCTPSNSFSYLHKKQQRQSIDTVPSSPSSPSVKVTAARASSSAPIASSTAHVPGCEFFKTLLVVVRCFLPIFICGSAGAGTEAAVSNSCGLGGCWSCGTEAFARGAEEAGGGVGSARYGAEDACGRHWRWSGDGGLAFGGCGEVLG